MRKKLIIIFLFLLIPFFVRAYTKEDIIKLVENQKICDQETEDLYARYFKIYSRLLNAKDIDEITANQIYTKIVETINTVNKYNICSVDDLDEIPSSVKKEIQDNLYESSKLIIKSPNLSDSDTTIKYNDDNTIDIYDGGEYIDRVTLDKKQFNYVGFSKYFVYFKYVLPISLVIFIFLIIVTRKKIIINNCMIILLVITLFANIFYFTVGEYAYDIYNLIKSLNYKETAKITEMQVKNKKIITYPNYGAKYGILKIEGLGIELPIYYGDSKEILKKGIGHTSAFPGFNGATILSGHNSKIFLNNLKNIRFDNIITIETNYGNFKYKVVKMEILKENEYNYLIRNDKSLILYTCYPFDQLVYSENRFIVYGKLVEEVWYQ